MILARESVTACLTPAISLYKPLFDIGDPVAGLPSFLLAARALVERKRLAYNTVMDTCLECNAQLSQLDNRHLASCCGLTLQEYALRHGLSLDVVVPRALLDYEVPLTDYPRVTSPASREARVVLAAVRAAGMLEQRRSLFAIPGEIRRLDQLLWLMQHLRDYGFCFRQSYRFDPRAHRVTATSSLKSLRDNLPDSATIRIKSLSTSDLLLFMATIAALRSDIYGDYLFLHFAGSQEESAVLTNRLGNDFGVEMKSLLPFAKQSAYLRTLTSKDTRKLLGVLYPQLSRIPCAEARFYGETPEALVAKEMVFDAAHFITDHPGKCVNLHGGRYNLVIKVKGRIDPYTGFVVDYGYLKAVVQREVIEALDHKHLNLTDTSLGWRSSTELINLFIWRKLIEYLPNLYELQTYETVQSYCCFRGPTLDEMRRLRRLDDAHFASAALGRSSLRRLLVGKDFVPRLTVVG